MKKPLIAVFAFAAILYSFYATAAMTCSITDAGACTGTIVLKLSALNDGGSHVGLSADSSFPKAVCCSGVPGLAVSTASGEQIGWISSNDDAHISQTGAGAGSVYLTASSAVTCTYNPDTCLSGNTCLLSVSGDEDAHASGCEAGDFPFSDRLCCRAGAGGCSIDEAYWGILDESGLQSLAGTEPLGPVGLGMDVFMIAETSGCEGSTGDFTIYTDGGDSFNSSSTIQGIPLGSYKAGEETGAVEDGEGNPIPNVVIAWWAAGSGDGSLLNGNYKFKLELTSVSPAYSMESGFSPVVEVSDGCGMGLADLESYFVCTGPDTPPGCCGDTLPAECSTDFQCPGGFCPDTDCDGVPNCIDEYLATVPDPGLVDRCSGTAAGTAGCVPYIDCTNLPWSECKNCGAGEPCDKQGGFSAGDQFTERCEGLDEASCACKWGTPSGDAPGGCSDAALNQWENRFKACIEEEEFPVFTGFNIIAVLAILSIYYAIVIARKKK